MLQNIFPTPIYEHTGTIEETFLVQHEIKNRLPYIFKTDVFENPIDWNDGVQTNIKSRYNSIKDFELVNLEKYIESHVRKYFNLTVADEPKPTKLCHSWVNTTAKGQRQDWHQHQDAVISGTYYFQTTGNDGDIIFRSPNQFINIEWFPFGQMHRKHFRVRPEAGKIVLFPGWLDHCVEENNTDNIRISISFNYLRDNFHSQE